jgi:hypothetical protein
MDCGQHPAFPAPSFALGGTRMMHHSGISRREDDGAQLQFFE